MMLVLYHLDLVENYTLNSLLQWLAAAGFRTDIRNKTTHRGWILASR
jgi:hypothetical protein